LRNLNSDLGRVKSETAAVMADEQRAKRKLDECTEEIEKIQRYTIKAVSAGNDSDARLFIEKKQALVAKQAELSQMYAAAHANSANMRAMNDKLVKDIAELEERRNAVKVKINMARAQEHINNMVSSTDGANSSISAFERMEEKADQMLDRANAMAELNSLSPDDEIESLKAKYDSSTCTDSGSAVEEELAALKASLGK
ncbi:MAG TPA: phage shock protein A, partial [Lachnospiraceae bacterium]|nr:phage shock protein A [Lachnospiraceae bacterium]